MARRGPKSATTGKGRTLPDASAPDDRDPRAAALIDSAQARELLDVPRTTLRRLVTHGELAIAKVASNRAWWFRRVDVEACKRRRDAEAAPVADDGAAAARAFEAFASGYGPADLTIRDKVPPASAIEWFRAYQACRAEAARARGGALLDASHVRRIGAALATEGLKSGEDVAAYLEAFTAARCATCDVAAPVFCAECARTAAHRQAIERAARTERERRTAATRERAIADAEMGADAPDDAEKSAKSGH